MANKCPYCEYVTPEPEDGDQTARHWQEIAHMQLDHPQIVNERLHDAGMLDPNLSIGFAGKSDDAKSTDVLTEVRLYAEKMQRDADLAVRQCAADLKQILEDN